MKKVISLLLAAVVSVGIFSACSKDEKMKVSVYFKDALSNELNEEIHSVKSDSNANSADIAKLAVSELIKGPQNEKNSPVIDREAKLLSLVVNNGVATVNMSKHFLEKKGAEELLLRFALVNTICSVEGINGIVIQVEGKPIVSEKTGKEYGVLSISDIALNTEDNITIKLYFPDKNGEKLVLERRTVDAQNALSIEKTVISELIKGPIGDSLSPSLPEGTKLLGIENKDSVCYVNFSNEFKTKSSSGSTATTLALYSVVNSLCALENVSSVQVLVNGEAGVEFGNFVLDIPYEANSTLIK